MDTNDLQQSLLDTIDLVSTKIANSTNAPLTIKAESLICRLSALFFSDRHRRLCREFRQKTTPQI